MQGREARVWWLHSEHLEDTNEYDWSPAASSVTVKENEIDFASGKELDLPPATIMAVEWFRE